jgi:hypothetical protein
MNTPTETLAERLTSLNAWRRGEVDDRPISAKLIGETIEESARRLLAQQATIATLDARIAELEGQLEEVRGYYTDALDSSRIWKAKADRYWQELEQERQDRKQADLDTIRALGERNDARKELEETSKDYLCLAELLDGHDATECRANLVRMKADLQAERALADRLGFWLDVALSDHDKYDLMNADEALAAWKDARRK